MLDIIKTRRSIRKYQAGRPVDAELIDRLLEAAMYAPSARNLRPWSFIVCTDRAVIDGLHIRHPYSSMLETAPVCVVVCGDADASPDYYQQDCSAATQNILLAAHASGIGTCWMGVSPNPERMAPIAAFLGLPEHIKPFCLIAVGWPDEEKPAPDRVDRGKMHYGKW